jgi:hypothetical protein
MLWDLTDAASDQGRISKSGAVSSGYVNMALPGTALDQYIRKPIVAPEVSTIHSIWRLHFTQQVAQRFTEAVKSDDVPHGASQQLGVEIGQEYDSELRWQPQAVIRGMADLKARQLSLMSTEDGQRRSRVYEMVGDTDGFSSSQSFGSSFNGMALRDCIYAIKARYDFVLTFLTFNQICLTLGEDRKVLNSATASRLWRVIMGIVVDCAFAPEPAVNCGLFGAFVASLEIDYQEIPAAKAYIKELDVLLGYAMLCAVRWTDSKASRFRSRFLRM